MFHRFWQIPANSVKFQPCDITAQAEYFVLTFSTHILQYELTGSQILLDTHTFMPQRQLKIVCYIRTKKK